MGKARGFLEFARQPPSSRSANERVRDWREFELPLAEPKLREQGARCMDCGIPFCHSGCPLGNLIPDWNDHVFGGRFEAALRALHATNNLPEVTGRVCPAPCEASCVLNLEGAPVTIKAIEKSIIDRGFELGLVVPEPAEHQSGKRVAVVGSGPAGLAAAQQLARRGHAVTVFEKADRVGGLLRYGIPDFKMEKALIDRRVAQMEAEGVAFKTRVHCGVPPLDGESANHPRGELTVTAAELRRDFDALLLCCGAMKPRDLEVPGRALDGVHFAMDFLTQQNRRVAGDAVGQDGAILATGKRVVVLGGGDTGSDCVGTSLRQGAASVTSLELMPRPPETRSAGNPWPEWPLIFRTSSSHDEGGERDFAVMTKRLIGDAGRLVALEAVRAERQGSRLVEKAGSEFSIPCDLVLLAMGFVGPVKAGLVDELGVALDARGNVATTRGHTSVRGVFAAGDMARGQSLVVWAIAEGRKVAAEVDAFLLDAQPRTIGM
jgi:glutamate synthase (NADPH/NADH) small chain